jgi:peroxiredoxin
MMKVSTKSQRPIVIALFAGVLVAGAALLLGVGNSSAPAVSFTTLAGKPIAPEELRGKVVLVNFWATTCEVCARELPQIVGTYQTYASRGFEVIAVAMPYDRPDWVVDYARRHELPFKVALDFEGTINRAFGGIEATPTAFLIDKRGKILQRIVGEPDFARLRTMIERELDPGGAG